LIYQISPDPRLGLGKTLSKKMAPMHKIQRMHDLTLDNQINAVVINREHLSCQKFFSLGIHVFIFYALIH